MHDAIEKGHYAPLSKWIHAIVALIVIPMVLGSFYLEDISKAYRSDAVNLHKSFGILILALMLIRLIYIHISSRPALPKHVHPLERFISRFVQYALYICLILMPLCGWIMASAAGKYPNFFYLGKLPFPGIPVNDALSDLMFSWHHNIAFIIIGLLFFHILGALKHYFYDKDGVMQSMWSSWRK